MLPLLSCSHQPLPELMAWSVVPEGDPGARMSNWGLRLSLYATISPATKVVPPLPVVMRGRLIYDAWVLDAYTL